MDRSADYSIQGFHYQFNKTLLEVLKAADDAEITVEGIVEDIEITEPAGITAIQCKYHEARESYAISGIYKPLLQMMLHFHNNQQANIRYIIFAHFPNPPPSYVVSRADLEAALASKNDKLRRYCDALNGQIDLDRFLQRISVQFGESWDAMITSVHTALLAAGIPKGDIDTLAYPNAIQAIANLSMQHDINQRRITKAVLVAELRRIKSTAITRWTLAPANAHLTVERAISSHASATGFAGYMESMVTMLIFSSRSKNHAPSGITLYLRIGLVDENPRWNSHEMSNPKKNRYTIG